MKHTLRALVFSAGLVTCGLAFMLIDAQAQSGSLEPPSSAVSGGLPVPTTQTQPSWDQALPANDGDPATGCNSTRFKCVLGDAAVLDIETGLVWDRVPDPEKIHFHEARGNCLRRVVGERRGWRMPYVHELSSLLKSTNGGGQFLPAGHPFSVELGDTFSLTKTFSEHLHSVWFVNMSGGATFGSDRFVEERHFWCVRGGGALSEH